MDQRPAMRLSRRQALTGAALTFGAVWTTLSAASSATAQGVLTWTPTALGAGQARTLEAIAERIIPATDTPGAREAGVARVVDRNLKSYLEAADAAVIRAGLDRADADALAAHGAGFSALSADRQDALLARYDAEAARAGGRHFFAMLKELVTVAYFTSELGATKAVRYDPVPGEYRGCVPLKEIGRAWAT
jgi:gluconate 2-dehydrogenase gamma chain